MDIPIFVLTVKNTVRCEILLNYYNSESKFKNIEIIQYSSGYELNFELLEKDGYFNKDSFMCFKIYNYKNKELYYGTFGCAYAHLMLYKKMLDENIEECIVLEDNILLVDGYLEELENLIKKLKKHNYSYDIIHLHSWNKVNNNIRELLIDDVYKGNNECGGTKIYYLNKKTAKVLYINNMPITSVSDGITAIPSRNYGNYNLTSLYYEFKNCKFNRYPSIRGIIDNCKDTYKNKVEIENQLKNYTSFQLILNDKKIVYKLNDNLMSQNFIKGMNKLLNNNKIVPRHYKYNLYGNNNQGLNTLFIEKLLDLGKKEKFISDDLLNLLETKNYKEIYSYVDKSCNININLKGELLDIIRRFYKLDERQFITTMVKCSNWNIQPNYFENCDGFTNDKYLEFGKMYITCDNIEASSLILYFSFGDYDLKNDSKLFFKIGDIVLNEDLLNLNNDEIINYYSSSILENIVII